MKTLKLLFTACIFLAAIAGYSQYNSNSEYNNIQLGFTKTTSILFPYTIKSLDIGSRDVLVQKAKGVENILLLKAGKQNFLETNLTVVTSDGRLYIFLLNYDEDCPDLNMKAENPAASNKDIVFSTENENQKKIEEFASLALSKKKKTSGLKRAKFNIRMEVSGIFILQDLLYVRVMFENRSKINYNIDQLRFFIRDKKKSKRTAMQEIEILPVYCSSPAAVIADYSEITKIYALEKFTIPENKQLTLQLIEKNGGRHLEVNINHNNLADKVFSIEPFPNNDF